MAPKSSTKRKRPKSLFPWDYNLRNPRTLKWQSIPENSPTSPRTRKSPSTQVHFDRPTPHRSTAPSPETQRMKLKAKRNRDREKSPKKKDITIEIKNTPSPARAIRAKHKHSSSTEEFLPADGQSPVAKQRRSSSTGSFHATMLESIAIPVEEHKRSSLTAGDGRRNSATLSSPRLPARNSRSHLLKRKRNLSTSSLKIDWDPTPRRKRSSIISLEADREPAAKRKRSSSSTSRGHIAEVEIDPEADLEAELEAALNAELEDALKSPLAVPSESSVPVKKRKLKQNYGSRLAKVDLQAEHSQVGTKKTIEPKPKKNHGGPVRSKARTNEPQKRQKSAKPAETKEELKV